MAFHTKMYEKRFNFKICGGGASVLRDTALFEPIKTAWLVTTLSPDVESCESDEENRNLIEAWDKARSDDEEHPNQAGDMELVHLPSHVITCDIHPPPQKVTASKPYPSTRPTVKNNSNDISKPITICNDNLITLDNTEEQVESTDGVLKISNQTFSLIDAIYNYKNKELISWLENYIVANACPITILAAACEAQSNKEALRILLDAGREPKTFRCTGITPLHFAALTNEPKRIAKILSFPEGLSNEGTYDYPKVRYSGLWKKMKSIPLGYTALHVASAAAHAEGVGLLLRAGANPNQRDFSNSTPLDVAGAASSDDDVKLYVETLQLLYKYGGSIINVDNFVLERALRKRSLEALRLLLDAGAPTNYLNPSGYTPVHLCVELKLKEHLQVLVNHFNPQLCIRPVDVTDKDGNTVLHWATREQWIEGVTVVLSARAHVTVQNSDGDTALHLAAKAGNFDIVKKIIEHDKNMREWKCKVLNENVVGESPFSYAILSGNADILKLMCEVKHCAHDSLHTIKFGELGPLEYALEKKFHKLFITILDLIVLNKDETVRILNFIAKNNLPEKFTELKNRPLKYLRNVISTETILHEAIKHSSREMIIVLLREGADLSLKKDGQTAISLLMYHMTKPTELMTEILDGCIKTDKNIYDKDCIVKIDYSVLKPENNYEGIDAHKNDDHLKTKANDMKVLEALIETGDANDQRSLLTHPVIESFLYLKWKKCAKFIYNLITAYVLFLIPLNTFIVNMYYIMDHKIKENTIFFIFNPIFWRVTAFFTLLFFCLMDFFYLSSSITKWRRNKTMWLKLLLIVGGLTMICMPINAADTDIVRGVAVLTVSFSWMYLMILLSWTPVLGYYMQMYGKVSWNVIKVMLSFSFPLVSFSICFMILMHSQEPFDGPIAAFMKTMVMMSSEFEYENLVKNKTTDSPTEAQNSTISSLENAPVTATSMYMIRLLFLLFFICVAIVLMNLMLGVAVSDFQELSHDGEQRRLMKQIECIIALETLSQRRTFSSFLFTDMEMWTGIAEEEIKPDSKIFSKEIKESILNKAQSLKETKEKEEDDVGLKSNIDAITKTQTDLGQELADIRKSVNTISETVEKRIDAAIDKILGAIANDRRAD